MINLITNKKEILEMFTKTTEVDDSNIIAHKKENTEAYYIVYKIDDIYIGFNSLYTETEYYAKSICLESLLEFMEKVYQFQKAQYIDRVLQYSKFVKGLVNSKDKRFFNNIESEVKSYGENE